MVQSPASRVLVLAAVLSGACTVATPVGPDADPPGDAPPGVGGSPDDPVETPPSPYEGRCDGALPGASPVVITADCDDLSSHDEPFAGGTALRLVGVYETAAPHDETGEVELTVDLDHDAVLVLTSYESARWIVDHRGAGRIVRIIVNGYDPQEVVAPSGVPVEATGYFDGGGYWGTAYDWAEHDTRSVVARAEAMTGLALTSAHGCYRATNLTMTEGCDGPVSPSALDCEAAGEPGGPPDPSVLPAACDAVTRESAYCLTLTAEGGLAALGLDSGTLCPFGSAALDEPYDVSSIAWADRSLFACAASGRRLARIDLRDGSVEVADVWCEAVAAHGTGLLVEPSWEEGLYFGEMWRYPTFRDARCGRAEVLSVEANNTRITVWGDTLYSAWHSTDTIERLALPSGGLLDPIHLEGYDTWVMGMSVVGGVLALNASWPEGRIALFDALDGTHLRDVPVETPINGLACVPGR